MRSLFSVILILGSLSSFAGWDAETDLKYQGYLLSDREFAEFSQAVEENRLMFRGSDVLKDFCFISNKFARKQAKQKCVEYAVNNDLNARKCREFVTFTDGSGDFCNSTSYYVID